jgi:hypothetical protein
VFRINDLLSRVSHNSAIPLFGRRRRIHLYGVGLPKSGTASIAQLFSEYRSSHEPENREFLKDLNLYLKRQLSEAQMRRLLRERDRKLALEVESSHFYVYVVDLLVAMHPAARFVLTIREPISWLRSFINDTHGFDSRDPSSVWNVYRDLRMRTAVPPPAEEKSLAEAGLYSLEGYFSYWRTHIERVTEAVPSKQLFVVRTSEISNKLQELADFADVPLSSLHVEKAHSHKGERKLELVDGLDQVYLARKCLEVCSELLERWLPDDHARLTQIAAQCRQLKPLACKSDGSFL